MRLDIRSDAAILKGMKKPGVLLLVLALGPALLAGFFFGALYIRWHTASTATRFNTTAVVQQVQGLSDLVTVKYVIEKVVILEDARWYGENRLLLLAHGIVKAGIPLGEIKPEDVNVDGKTITITLPKERITDAYLDEKKTGVIERSTGLIRYFDESLEQNARRAAVADIRTAAKVNGIHIEARERAELQLRAFLLQLGFEEVSFK